LPRRGRRPRDGEGVHAPQAQPDGGPDTLSDAASSDGTDTGRTIVIGCGAVARELVAVLRANRLEHRIRIACLPAILHNRPERIAPRLRTLIRKARAEGYDDIRIAYGDCGSGGDIDRVLAEEGGERLPGAHCYAFYAGRDAFEAMMEEEIGTFFLTDYLVRQFDALIIRGLGIDRHPQLLAMYFEHYRRVVYLAQTDDPALDAAAQAAAARLGLAYERRYTGLGGLSMIAA
jgi:hypothetical protein